MRAGSLSPAAGVGAGQRTPALGSVDAGGHGGLLSSTAGLPTPGLCAELNPAEQLWSWSKDKKLANFVPDELGDLAAATEHVVSLAEHDPKRLQGFFNATPLRWT